VRILALTHGLWLGGAQIATLELLELLKDKVELKVLTCDRANEEFTSRITSMGIPVHRAHCKLEAGYPVIGVNSAQSLIQWADVAWITDVEYPTARLVKNVKNIPVIAHLHSYALICPRWDSLYGRGEVCLKKCSPWRIIRCRQGHRSMLFKVGALSIGMAGMFATLDIAKGPYKYMKWVKLLNMVLESIDGYIPVSNTLWDIHVRHVPELGGKPYAVVYNPVIEPLKYVKPNPNEPYGNYIFYASGPNPVKGPHILLDAWSTVSKQFKDLKLYMVGCKDSWVEKYAKRLSLNNIVFVDKLPSRNYYHTMYKARAVVMPSIWPEAFGRIPVEANRLGVPAVVTDQGGLKEIVEDGVTGYLSKPRSEELASKIMKVLEKSFNREAIIQESYIKVDPGKQVEKMLNLVAK